MRGDLLLFVDDMTEDEEPAAVVVVSAVTVQEEAEDEVMFGYRNHDDDDCDVMPLLSSKSCFRRQEIGQNKEVSEIRGMCCNRRRAVLFGFVFLFEREN